jgi:hypothetical protein
LRQVTAAVMMLGYSRRRDMELPVQAFLRRQYERTALDELSRCYGVNSTVKDGLVILNYDQLEAKKGCPVADDCRALTLRYGTWEVVARSFRRFYNLGERPDESLDWTTAVAQEKLDGSLMVLFHTGRDWRVNTRGSFAEQPIVAGGKSWAGVFWMAMFDAGLFDDLFDPDYAYSFELCSPWNQVVVYHERPSLHLLAAFDRDGNEMPEGELRVIGATMPNSFRFDSPEAARLFVESRPGRTHEGVVVRDGAGKRVKVKSTHYLHYHRLKNNGNGFAVANLVPLVLNGEAGEVAAVFPEVADRIATLERRVTEEREKAEAVWERCRGIESQKEFALAILGRTETPAVLFTARKCGIPFAEAWKGGAEKPLVAKLEKEFSPT